MEQTSSKMTAPRYNAEWLKKELENGAYHYAIGNPAALRAVGSKAQDVIDSRCCSYMRLNKKHKKSFIEEEVIAIIESKDGLFLEEDKEKGDWVQVPADQRLVDKLQKPLSDRSRKYKNPDDTWKDEPDHHSSYDGIPGIGNKFLRPRGATGPNAAAAGGPKDEPERVDSGEDKKMPAAAGGAAPATISAEQFATHQQKMKSLEEYTIGEVMKNKELEQAHKLEKARNEELEEEFKELEEAHKLEKARNEELEEENAILKERVQELTDRELEKDEIILDLHQQLQRERDRKIQRLE